MKTSSRSIGRVVLKISGEGFGHSGKSGISIDETLNIARQAQRVVQRGVQLAIVVGGGNILRGAQFSAGGAVIRRRPPTTWACWPPCSMAWPCKTLWRASIARRGFRPPSAWKTWPSLTSAGAACVTWKKAASSSWPAAPAIPFVTTDTAAALRARELEADIVLKATRVDGVFSDDPEQ